MARKQCSCPKCSPPKEDYCAPKVKYIKGDTGDRGPQGSEGPRGKTGAEGCQGEKGDTGDRGYPGQDGCKGKQGVKGDKGEEGAKGCQGKQGETGEKGAPGTTGLQGDKGDKGNTGERGEKGDAGQKGETGDRGITGDRGEKGDTGEKGDRGDVGLTGARGRDGEDGDKGDDGDRGPSGFISCEFDDEENCYEITARLEDGSEKDLKLSGCISLLACGYAGNPICVRGATGTVVESSDNGVMIEVVYDISGGELTSVIEIDDTISTGTTSVGNFRFEDGRWCYDVRTRGKLDITNRFETKGLPRTKGSAGLTPNGCRSAMSGSAEIEGLIVGNGQATQINKQTGGEVTQRGFNNLGSSNYDVESDNNSWVDTISQPNVFGGDTQNTVGSRHSFIVDTFRDNEQRFTVCEEFCYYEPIEYETDVNGNPARGTGKDVDGNSYSGTVFNYDGSTVEI